MKKRKQKVIELIDQLHFHHKYSRYVLHYIVMHQNNCYHLLMQNRLEHYHENDVVNGDDDDENYNHC
jgi:hypothetical protein